MIDIKLLDSKTEEGINYFNSYKTSLEKRGASLADLQNLIELNKKRKDVITRAETAKATQNKMSGEIAVMKKNKQDTTQLLADLAEASKQVKELEAQAAEAELTVLQAASYFPNKLHESVPKGNSAEENVNVKTVGEPKKFSFKAKEHFELGEKLGILDFERAGKVTGARFTFLRGAAARLERALIQFFLDSHTQNYGYEELVAPYIVNSNSLYGTGNFPKFKTDVFHLAETDYYLIPTAEVPVTNIFKEETLNETDLPKKFAAFSPCFRSEAGSHGRDTKGLIRQHQFHKVELMIFSHPQKSYELHEQLTTHAEKILEDLELPYKRMLLCSGDISFGAAKCFDLEVWLPGANAYREISSCSNFEDFQARRANIRFKPQGGGKPAFVHTINGSGLAVGRTLIAIFENYQQEDGTIVIPKALRKYMNNLELIK